jgi:hypothetical protein
MENLSQLVTQEDYLGLRVLRSLRKFNDTAYLQKHCGSLRLRGTQLRVQGLDWTEDSSKPKVG